MRKDNSFITGDNEDLEEFEAHLKVLAESGEIPYPVSEREIEDLNRECAGLTLPPEVEEKYLNSLKKAYEDLAIEKVRKKLYGDVKVFGRHIQYIRKEANLSPARIAERLGKDKKFVENLESGQLNPLQVATGTIADIMEIFNMNLKELVLAVKKFFQLPPMAETASLHARADRKIGEKEMLEDISMAMDDLLSVSSNKKQKEVSVPEEFLADIKAELQQRGRIDLI